MGYPLDLVAGATFAVSTRKLRSAYAGYAIRVRRSSDNTEQDIGFSGDDLDVTSMLSFVGANNGFVVCMYDQVSGSTNKAYQSSATIQPQIVAAGVVINVINGKPCLKFDGTNDYFELTNSGGTGLLASNFIINSAWTLYTASRANVIPVTSTIYNSSAVFASGLGGNSYMGTYYNTTSWLSAYIWDGGSKQANNTVATGVNYVTEARLQSSVLYCKNTGVPFTSIASSNVQNLSTVPRIGYGGTSLDGWVGEVIIYNSAVSAANRSILTYDTSSYWVFGAARGEYSFLQGATDASDLTTYTFAAQNLGAAAGGRHIIVCAQGRRTGTSATISSITVDGAPATIVDQVTNTATNTAVCGIAIVALPSGTSGDIVVTFSSGMIRCAIQVYRATGINATAYDTATSTTGDPSVALDVPNGFAVGSGLTAASTTAVWTGLTEDYDVTIEGFSTATSASLETSPPPNCKNCDY